MSLISEEERAGLEKLSKKELEESGFKYVGNLKPALRKEIFWVLANYTRKEAKKLLEERGIQLSYETIAGYRGALTANKLVRRTRRKRNKEELLKFLKENPDATCRDVVQAGLVYILRRDFRGRINEAKRVAGIGEKYVRPPRKPRGHYRLKDLIYGLLLASKTPLTLSEIAEVLHYSYPHVMHNLRKLAEEGKIRYRRILPGRSSRKPAYYYFNGLVSYRQKFFAYIPSDPLHVKYVIKKLVEGIKASGELTRDRRRGLLRLMKRLPDEIRDVFYFFVMERYREVFNLIAESNVPLKRSEITENLPIYVPDISSYLRKLREDGLIALGPSRRYRLTERGNELYRFLRELDLD
jgi:Mn-dependent DtxR family transcriptional regulator